MNIAINGFGRIGRTVLRSMLQRTNHDLTVVAINVGPDDPARLAHLFKYDTVMGIWPDNVIYADGHFHIGDHMIAVYQENDPAHCPWSQHGVSWVVEASGRFTKRDNAEHHRTAGAPHVLISAPGTNVDATFVYGINHTDYDGEEHKIISLASCTTNCLAPVVKVLHQLCGIESGMFTSIHAYTSDQRLLDSDHKDLRRARAAAQNIIPTKTGASKAITALFPDLADKLHGVAVRVPTQNVSMVDFTFTMSNPVDATALNTALQDAANDSLRDVLAYTDEPLVSSDYYQHRASAIVDGLMTATAGNQAKVAAWYDNEFGYCQRIVDFLLYVSR